MNADLIFDISSDSGCRDCGAAMYTATRETKSPEIRNAKWTCSGRLIKLYKRGRPESLNGIFGSWVIGRVRERERERERD